MLIAGAIALRKLERVAVARVDSPSKIMAQC